MSINGDLQQPTMALPGKDVNYPFFSEQPNQAVNGRLLKP